MRLDVLEVGGSYFRVLKLHMTAVYQEKPNYKKSDDVVRTFYPLLSAFIRVMKHNGVGSDAKCLNEVKRSGYIIDLHQ